MEETQTEALAAEVQAILNEGGAIQSQVAYNGAWLVAASFPCRGYADDGQNGMSGAIGPKAYAGDTRRTEGDPRELAAMFVADAKAHAEKMDAFFGVAEPSEEVENPRTYDEATAEYFAEHPEDETQAPLETGSAENDALAGLDAEALPDAEGEVGGSGLSEVEVGGAGEYTDADFEAIDDLGHEADLLEPPPPEDFAPDDIVPPDDASGAFIFGDNLHQLRTAAIGLVVQAALQRLPEPTDYAKLSELRNFAMGVSEDRWPDDPALRAELDALEAIERRRHAISSARDEKVAFLVEATREQIQDFSPEAGWPE